MKPKLVYQRDPIESVRPGLERALQERDKERAKEIVRRFMPERYKWLVDWIATQTGDGK